MNLKQYLQEQRELRGKEVDFLFQLDGNSNQRTKLIESFNLEEGLTTYLQDNDYKLIKDSREEKIYSNGKRIFGMIKRNKQDREYFSAELGKLTADEFTEDYKQSQKLSKCGTLLKNCAGIPLAGFILTGTFGGLIYTLSSCTENPPDSIFAMCTALISLASFTIAGITGGLASMMKMETHGNKLKTKADELLQKFTPSYKINALEKLVEICEKQ